MIVTHLFEGLVAEARQLQAVGERVAADRLARQPLHGTSTSRHFRHFGCCNTQSLVTGHLFDNERCSQTIPINIQFPIPYYRWTLQNVSMVLT